MSSLRIFIGIIWVATFLIGLEVWTASPFRVDSVADPDSTAVSEPLVGSDSAADEPRPGRIDLYGNEVEAAISDYRIDLTGDLYERHAPHTALPELDRPVI